MSIQVVINENSFWSFVSCERRKTSEKKERREVVAVKPITTPLRLVYSATFMMFPNTLVTNRCFLFISASCEMTERRLQFRQ